MRLVIDTNVLVEGLSRKGVCGRVVDLWAARRFIPCVSTTLAFEYEDVLTRRGSEEKIERLRRALQALLRRAEFVPVVFSYRPTSPDPGDDFVIDCAMNGRAGIVTSNTRDFRDASKDLGFVLMTPTEFVSVMKEK